MNFNNESSATTPFGWPFENRDRAGFTETDTPGVPTYPGTAIYNSQHTAIAGSSAAQTGFLDRRRFDPTINNEFSTIPGEDGTFLGEYNAEVNSSLWNNMFEFDNLISAEETPGTIDHMIQEKVVDNALPPGHVGFIPAESPTIPHLLTGNQGSDSFQPWSRSRDKSRKFSSKSQFWKQALPTEPNTAEESSNPKKMGLSMSEQQMGKAYYHLEVSYCFKPQATETQLQALAVFVELPYDDVRAFYEQNQARARAYISQRDYGQYPGLSHPAKRHCGSDASTSSERVNSANELSRSDSAASLPTSERSAIPRTFSFCHRVRELSQNTFECTWRDCLKSFKSKSDWKRHEEVHCPQWSWACTIETWPQEGSKKAIQCPREFKRNDHLREHLKKDHNCTDPSILEAGRQNLNPQSPFQKQCGFCGHMTRDWDDRVNHIGEHFKEGKTISEWKDPWPAAEFEGFDPSDDDDDDDDDDDNDHDEGDDKYNDNSKSHEENNTRTGATRDHSKGGNIDTSSGGFRSSSSVYMRPGSFGIKYQTPSHESDFTGNLRSGDSDSFRHDINSSSSFWSKMYNLLRGKGHKETSSALSNQFKKSAGVKASCDGNHQDQERIEFYCILCLKSVSKDPSLPNTDDTYCICSEVAIKEHMMSLANMNPGMSSPEKSQDSRCSERVTDTLDVGFDVLPESLEKNKYLKPSYPRISEKPTTDDSKLQNSPTEIDKECQQDAAADAEDESCSYSMRRYVKAHHPVEDLVVDRESPAHHRIYPINLTKTFPCRFYNCTSKGFKTLGARLRHESEYHSTRMKCKHCEFIAECSDHLNQHIEMTHLAQQGTNPVDIMVNRPSRDALDGLPLEVSSPGVVQHAGAFAIPRPPTALPYRPSGHKASQAGTKSNASMGQRPAAPSYATQPHTWTA